MLSEAPPGAEPAKRSFRPAAPGSRAGGVSDDVWIVVALVIVAAAIRFVTISSQSFWTDEALTGYETSLPFGAMIHVVMRVETTPPLYFVLIWVWAKLFGASEVALRSLSALAGIGLVPIAYLCGRQLFNRRAGALAAAFVTFSPFMIWYSQEARAYMLLAFLAGASFLFFLRARADPSRFNLAWWAVCSALAISTHFFAGFVIAPEALLLLWQWRTRSVFWAVGVVAAAQLAILPFALVDAGHGTTWIARTPRAFRLGQTALEFGVNTMFRSFSTAEGLIVAAAVLGAVALLIVRGGDQITRAGAAVVGAIVAFGFFVPLALGFFGQDYFLARNEIVIWLPLAIVCAGACVVPRGRVVGGALAAALLAMFVVSQITIQTNGNYQRPQWRTLAQAIGPAHEARAFIVAGGAAADALKWYLPGVTWVQPYSRVVLIREIDVIGTHKRLNLVRPGVATGGSRKHQLVGVAMPLEDAPPGSRLVRRFKVHGWIIGRFALNRPLRLGPTGVAQLASRFFRRVPKSLLVFTQRPTL
jgi:mannosyltransferase